MRPTLIYAEGRDTNITPLSRLIRRFGFMPLVGGAPGLRQPVHAEDLAIGAIAAAASPAAINKFYSLPGAETLTYREMIGRIFDGMGLPRRTVSVPPLLWRAGFVLAKPLFPGANVAMGIRMMKDMTFDSTPGRRGTSAGNRGPSIRCSTSSDRFAMDRQPSVHEHHRLAAIEDDAVFQVMAHGARQHAALDVAALADEVVGRIAVADALDVLVDDRAFVQVARDVMGGGADQLDAALMRLMVRAARP